MSKARLYLVATPIGNLGDMTLRAIEVLRSVDLIAAEDTRHSRRLLDHFNITAKLLALHEHNETGQAPGMVEDLLQGRSIALVSDAGTPLVSDPGYRLVQAAIEAGIEVVPVPGASAVTASLSVAGLPIDRFCFEGFLPAKSAQRASRFEALHAEPRTMVFFEAPHRIRSFVNDAHRAFGGERRVAISRELTKQFEQVWRGTLEAAGRALEAGDIPEKGEFVVCVGGNDAPGGAYDELMLMEVLLTELSPSAAASVASKLTGQGKKRLYDIALSLKKG